MFKKCAIFLCILFAQAISLEATEQKFFTVDSLTEEDKEIIEYLIMEMAVRDAQQLRELDRENKTVCKRFRRIHPLVLLNFLVSNPDLYQCTRGILQEEKKSKFLIAVLSMEIRIAKKEGILSEYIAGFSSLMQLDTHAIQTYIDLEDYKGLISYMFQL